jgi:hypothetical protein
MARRKRKQPNQDVIGSLLVLLACTWVALSAIQSFPGGLGGVLLLLLGVAGTLFIGSRVLRKNRRRRLLTKASWTANNQITCTTWHLLEIASLGRWLIVAAGDEEPI